MAKSGDVLINPDGEQLTFRVTAGESDGELLEVEMTYNPRSARPPEHYHPNQEEHFEVKSGAIHASIGGEEKTYGPGDDFTIPAGVAHWMHNTSDEVGRVVWQTRPAMRTETFFETIWGLAGDGRVSEDRSPGLLQIAVLGQAYADQFRLISPPYGLQRIFFLILAPIGKLLGYRAECPEYSPAE